MECQLERTPALNDEELTAIYRIAQETLTNALRHAEPCLVQVSLQADAKRLLLRVEDDGKGFQPQAGKQAQHYGLLGMQERAAMIGGPLKVQSRSGYGTSVSLSIGGNIL
jgi:signal transduction histidine kinase